MSSWAKSSASARRLPANPNGSAQQLRLFRRAAPYPNREDRTEELKDALESYEDLDQIQNYSGSVKYEGYKHQPNAKPDGCTPADRRKALYQKFYRQVQDEKKPADCVVLSVTNRCLGLPQIAKPVLAGAWPVSGNALPSGGIGPDPGSAGCPSRRLPVMYSGGADKRSSVLLHCYHILRIPQNPSQHAERPGHGFCCSRVQSQARQRAPAEGPGRQRSPGVAAAG
ncbi:hypothetical protein EPR50_G00083990 [Perca flavescens]|uniref:Uncharacterized protein n=1 Tax=Perca flavescens TaxID=8167 RepID=A0A484D3C4_PERFV|nr:hypothetical protein EPR50_G00083990 [Perca flavescens]